MFYMFYIYIHRLLSNIISQKRISVTVEEVSFLKLLFKEFKYGASIENMYVLYSTLVIVDNVNSLSLSVYMYVCMYVCIYIRKKESKRVRGESKIVYIYIHVYIYIYICVYIFYSGYS